MSAKQFIKIAVIAFLASFAVIFASAEEVVDLTGDSFESVVGRSQYAVVEFYAPWCGHCKKLEPEYEQAAVKLKDLKKPYLLARCDVTDEDNKPLAQKYGVRGYPTLKMFKNGSVENALEYRGPRDSEGIVNYLLKTFGPPSTELADAAAIKGFLSKASPAIVGVFKSDSDSEFKIFSKVAEAKRESLDFAHTFAADAIEGEKKPAPAVFVYLSADTAPAKYTGGFKDEQELASWIEKKSMPELTELDQSNPVFMKAVAQIFSNDKPKLLAFATSDFAKIAEFKTVLKEINAENDIFNVLYVDPTKNDQAQKFFGIEKEDYPAVVIHEPANNAKFLTKNTEVGSLKDWVAKYKKKELEPFVKSEEVPETNEGAVKVIVAKSLKEWLDKGKDMLVEFYAPWCGHCKKLAPDYEKLAKHFEDNENIIIAKFDASANDVVDQSLDVKGFPTLIFFKKNGEVVKHTGERSLEALIKFVEENSGIAETNEAEEVEVAKEEEAKAEEKKEEL